MSKYSKSKKPAGKSKKGYKHVEGGHYCDYNPASVNPNTTQFEPTESTPITRRAQQAGMS